MRLQLQEDMKATSAKQKVLPSGAPDLSNVRGQLAEDIFESIAVDEAKERFEQQ